MTKSRLLTVLGGSLPDPSRRGSRPVLDGRPDRVLRPPPDAILPGRPGKPGWHTPPNHPPPLPWGGPNPYMCFVRGPCQTGPPLEGVQTTLPGTDPKPGGVGNRGFQGLEFQARFGHPKVGVRTPTLGGPIRARNRDPRNLGFRPPLVWDRFRDRVVWTPSREGGLAGPALTKTVYGFGPPGEGGLGRVPGGIPTLPSRTSWKAGRDQGV